MTYEQFKLAIFNMAASGPSFFPAVNAALRTVWNRENAGASAEELIRLAYNEYCRTHGIIDSAPVKPLVCVKEIDDICTELNWLADVTDDGLRHNKDTANTLRQAAKLLQTTIMKQP